MYIFEIVLATQENKVLTFNYPTCIHKQSYTCIS